MSKLHNILIFVLECEDQGLYSTV